MSSASLSEDALDAALDGLAGALDRLTGAVHGGRARGPIARRRRGGAEGLARGLGGRPLADGFFVPPEDRAQGGGGGGAGVAHPPRTPPTAPPPQTPSA